MKKSRMHITLLVIILGLIILSLISVLSLQLKESIQYNEVQKYYLYRIVEVLMLIIFGVLVEYKKVISVFRNGIHLNPYHLVGSFLLIIILVVPFDIRISYSGSIIGFFSFIINTISARSVLGILAGILLARSFSATTKLKQEAS